MKNTSSSLKNIFQYIDINPVDPNSFLMNPKKNNNLKDDRSSGFHQDSNQKTKSKLVEISKEIENVQEEFVCVFDKCMRKFKTINQLKEHYIYHITSKTFHCEFGNCGKIYKSKENLVLHIKNIHLKLKPYRCRFCDSSFSHRNGKTYHERKFHINYLPYKCSIGDCEASFASKSALNCHLNSQHLKNKQT